MKVDDKLTLFRRSQDDTYNPRAGFRYNHSSELPTVVETALCSRAQDDAHRSSRYVKRIEERLSRYHRSCTPFHTGLIEVLR